MLFTIKMFDVFESIVKTALFGLISVFGMRSIDSEADAELVPSPLNGNAPPEEKIFRVENRIPFAPSTSFFSHLNKNNSKKTRN